MVTRETVPYAFSRILIPPKSIIITQTDNTFDTCTEMGSSQVWVSVLDADVSVRSVDYKTLSGLLTYIYLQL